MEQLPTPRRERGRVRYGTTRTEWMSGSVSLCAVITYYVDRVYSILQLVVVNCTKSAHRFICQTIKKGGQKVCSRTHVEERTRGTDYSTVGLGGYAHAHQHNETPLRDTHDPAPVAYSLSGVPIPRKHLPPNPACRAHVPLPCFGPETSVRVPLRSYFYF